MAGALLAALLGLGAAACTSTAIVHTAEPVPKGEVQFGAGIAGHRHESGDGPSMDDQTLFALFPVVGGQVRYGLSESVDVGGRIASLKLIPTLALDLNWALLETPGFTLSFDPTVHLLASALGGEFRVVGLGNVLADIVKTEPVTVTVGAKSGVTTSFGTSLPMFAYGGTLLAEFPIAPASSTDRPPALVPYADLLRWRFASALSPGAVKYHTNLGVGISLLF